MHQRLACNSLAQRLSTHEDIATQIDEPILRVAAILRRSRATAASTDIVAVGALQIARSHHRVTAAGQYVELTATEFKLLLTLASRRGRVQSRAQLLEDVWEAAPDVQTRTVDMHIQRLRSKLGEAADLIETIRGFGYRIRSANGIAGGAS